VAESYYTQEVHGAYEEFDVANFDLESGDRLRNLKIAYATHGTLSPDKDNVILFPSWYSGTSKILEQAYIGEGRALDPTKYFIILANQIGNGLSSAPHNTPAASFPRISIGDDVRAQHLLLTEKFGISRLKLVLGGSMGAQQTYEWAVRFPDFVERAAPIAGTAKGTSHNKLLVETFKDAIMSDPRWDEGWYGDRSEVHRGLRRHARLFAASGFTPKLYNTEGWRSLGFTTPEDFLVGFVEGYFLPMDPNNLLTMLSKWHDGDVTRMTNGCLKTALSRITAQVSAIAIKEDSFFPLADIEAEQKLIPGSELKIISSDWGHLALFGVDPAYNAAVDTHLKALLAKKPVQQSRHATAEA
jgi:homoserine O-acetyltransferase/O-succinyltransferase